MAPTDSLVIADLFELMGATGGVQSDIPELINSAGTGAVFQLLAPDVTGAAVGAANVWDLGTPQPTVDLVQSLLLDGERPFGARASNRTITLPVKITAPDQVTLTAARELLIQAVDAQTFTMTWTPAATGLPMVFDCFRALPTVYSYGFLPGQPVPISIITLTFQALPYGRSDPSGLQNIAFSSPIIGGVSPPPPPAVLDNFSSVSGAHWSQDSRQFVYGPHSAHYTPAGLGLQAVTYARSGLSVGIAGLTSLSVWFGQSFDTIQWYPWPSFRSNITLRWTLTDNAGHRLSFHRTVNKVPYANNATTPKWTRITAPIPQGHAGFNYAQVTAYSLTASNSLSAGNGFMVRMNVWLDNVVANPPSLPNPASRRGVTYNIMGTAGTARTPVSCQFQLPRTGGVTQQLDGSGLWWPPVGVTSVKAECIGGGGAGGARTSAGFGGGGGGAEYAAEPALTVTPGTPVPFTSGAGGQSGASSQVVTFTNPGTGNWTCPAGVTTVLAECWGGGAAGAAGSGGGGGGEYAAEPSLAVTPGRTYTFTVGAGGSPLIPNQAHGYNSTFTGDSVTVTAHNGTGGLSGGTTGGTGGTGSGNTTHYNGGNGGTSPSSGGGGGGGSGGTSGAGNTGGNGVAFAGGTGAAPVTGGGAGGAGSNAPGFPVAGSAPGGGGGGGNSAWSFGVLTFGANNPGANGGNGQVRLTYAVAAGSPVSGGSTTFGSAISTGGVIVTANGGGTVALNSTAGGAGGAGSSNTVHFSGGAGGLGGTNGGGGGGSGGSAGAGIAGTAGASGGTGAPAVTGGGKGSNGATAANTAGAGTAPPGGGGGGSNSAGTGVAGGSGGNGYVLVSHSPPLASFNTLIAHRPGPDSPDMLNPCVPITNTADAPAGIEYPVPSLVPGVNAMFNGTYTVVLVNYNWDNPSVTRIITVTVTQYEYGGAAGSQQSLTYQSSVTRAVTPATDITNGICVMGEITLPVKEVDPSNTSGYFTVSITDTDNNDQFLDVLFLDTQGSTVMINIPNNTFTNFFISEPTPDRDLGLILGSDLDLSQAVSVLDTAIVSGSPFYIVPGDNLFFCYTVQGAPDLAVSYLPRWYLERLV